MTRKSEKRSAKEDALMYLAEATRLAKVAEPSPVERVQLRSFLEMATEQVEAIAELKRARKKEPADA